MLFVAYDSKAKLALGVLGCGAFLVVGVFIWKQGSTEYRTFAAIDWLFSDACFCWGWSGFCGAFLH
jgi:hypothetical protein